jgi:ABC-type branched-subunit amino acid transport system substrate-binding protein
VNDWLVAEHKKRFGAPPDFFTAGGFAAAMAIVAAVEKIKSTDTEKFIGAMAGMEFDTPKGKMIFRKEDHQALQSMYAFKIRVDPNSAWAIPSSPANLRSRIWTSRSATSDDAVVGNARANHSLRRARRGR